MLTCSLCIWRKLKRWISGDVSSVPTSRTGKALWEINYFCLVWSLGAAVIFFFLLLYIDGFFFFFISLSLQSFCPVRRTRAVEVSENNWCLSVHSPPNNYTLFPAYTHTHLLRSSIPSMKYLQGFLLFIQRCIQTKSVSPRFNWRM